MEEAIQLILQGGALGLLAYLILWTTRDGAPRLFERLSAIQVAISTNTAQMKSLEDKVDTANTKVDDLREEVNDLRLEITRKGT